MKTFTFISLMVFAMGNAYAHVVYNQTIFSHIVSKLEIKIETTSPKNQASIDGTLSVEISGGTAPYTTHIAGTNFPAETFYKNNFKLSNLGIGSFTIIVQDQSKQVIYKNIDIKVQ